MRRGLAHDVLRVAGDGRDLEAGPLEHERQPGAHQRLVLADHDAHGSSAQHACARAERALDPQPAAERLDAVGHRADAVATACAPDSVVADVDPQLPGGRARG